MQHEPPSIFLSVTA